MRREIKIIMVLQFLIALGLGLAGPFYATYASNKFENQSVLGYSYAALWITVGLLSPIFGRLSDKKNKKYLLIIGGVLAFASSIAYNYITKPYQLILAEIVSGVATAIFTPVYNALIADVTSKKHRGKEYGMLEGVSSLSYGVAGLIGGFLVTIISVNTLFVLSGIFNLLSSMFMAAKNKEY